MPRRILVSGARKWVDVPRVELAFLRHVRPGDIVIHGASVEADGNPVGLDWIADALWREFGPVERYPAADFPDPLARNLHMIGLGADVCLTFALQWGSGTGHCSRHARAAGIPTFDYGVSTAREERPRGRR